MARSSLGCIEGGEAILLRFDEPVSLDQFGPSLFVHAIQRAYALANRKGLIRNLFTQKVFLH